MLTVLAGSVLALIVPKLNTPIILVCRFLVSIFICLSIVLRFEVDMCGEDVKMQIKHFRTIVTTKQVITNLYICMGIFFTPFCDRFFANFIASSIYFAIEYLLIDKYYFQ